MTIGSTILQNELKSRLPPDFSALFPGGAEIAYAAIPALHGLEPELRAQGALNLSPFPVSRVGSDHQSSST